MNKILNRAIENQSEQDLIEFLHFREHNEIDSSQYDAIEKALLGIWHSQHEDLLNKIYLENLKDDRFIDPIINIAINKDIYRLYDDELESTLRKCVHALKTIDSEKSNKALKKLEDLNNENVKFALEIYKIEK